MMTLVPEAYRNHPSLRQEYPEAESFYDFYAGMQEAWDGPALLVFSDGETEGWSGVLCAPLPSPAQEDPYKQIK
eukprot:438933-Prorocentrum_minimum.AAC.2